MHLVVLAIDPVEVVARPAIKDVGVEVVERMPVVGDQNVVAVVAVKMVVAEPAVDPLSPSPPMSSSSPAPPRSTTDPAPLASMTLSASPPRTSNGRLPVSVMSGAESLSLRRSAPVRGLKRQPVDRDGHGFAAIARVHHDGVAGPRCGFRPRQSLGTPTGNEERPFDFPGFRFNREEKPAAAAGQLEKIGCIIRRGHASRALFPATCL